MSNVATQYAEMATYICKLMQLIDNLTGVLAVGHLECHCGPLHPHGDIALATYFAPSLPLLDPRLAGRATRA